MLDGRLFLTARSSRQGPRRETSQNESHVGQKCAYGMHNTQGWSMLSRGKGSRVIRHHQSISQRTLVPQHRPYVRGPVRRRQRGLGRTGGQEDRRTARTGPAAHHPRRGDARRHFLERKAGPATLPRSADWDEANKPSLNHLAAGRKSLCCAKAPQGAQHRPMGPRAPSLPLAPRLDGRGQCCTKADIRNQRRMERANPEPVAAILLSCSILAEDAIVKTARKTIRLAMVAGLAGLLLLFAWLASRVDSGPLESRDVKLADVRIHDSIGFSTTYGPSEKYFHESIYHPHYDSRFPLSYEERRKVLPLMVHAFLTTMRDIGAETWIMHGTLLGWWWNGKILPWDSDTDFQVTESTMRYLANYYNMSVHRYEDADSPDGKDFLLEINPNYVNRDRSDRHNVIDARWVDTTTGLFADITVVARNHSHPTKGMLSCKDGHDYLESSIFPLRDSTFEGIPVKIPYAYVGILAEEYGKQSLTRTKFAGYVSPLSCHCSLKHAELMVLA
ncbi:hypothetical protein GP486_002531 [Trichoglossum hirsutum]|uniref:LicD/FKTN/FKRP nucleotidyltransferase domain-containing protein n=1 Tax=Trichoglossum hirsutum TaxID=265104 RepID=A0A9P8RS09_9PEZI|nr:hypothetical protein GP486_002531 [Trichoglossum hirsutum]